MVEGGAKEVPEARAARGAPLRPSRAAPAARSAGRAAAPGRQAEARGAGAAGHARRSRPRVRGMARGAARARRLRIKDKKSATRRSPSAESAVVETIAGEFKRAPASFDSLEAVETRRSELRRLVAQTKNILHDLRSEVMRERILDGRRAHRRPQHHRHPADRLRASRRAARPRLGAVHARRDAGAGLDDARQRRRRADDRRADRTLREALHPALQLPAVLGRRGAAAARPGPARGRPRNARRARDRARAAGRRPSSRTRSASSPRCSSRTARRRWRRSAAGRSR